MVNSVDASPWVPTAKVVQSAAQKKQHPAEWSIRFEEALARTENNLRNCQELLVKTTELLQQSGSLGQ
jgi:hypothetical protein